MGEQTNVIKQPQRKENAIAWNCRAKKGKQNGGCGAARRCGIALGCP
jgi:hypothetical protein